MHIENHERAIAEFEKAVSINSHYPYPVINLGNEYLVLGNVRLAGEFFAKAVDLAPDNADLFFNSGLLQERLGNDKEAESRYRRALEIKPDFFEARKKLEALKQR